MPLNTVDVLAAARLVRLVRRDSITRPLREALIAEAYTWRQDYAVPRAGFTWEEHALMDEDAPKLAELLRCSWCVGVWVAAGVVAARRWAPAVWEPVARVLAVSFLATVIESTADQRLA